MFSSTVQGSMYKIWSRAFRWQPQEEDFVQCWGWTRWSLSGTHFFFYSSDVPARTLLDDHELLKVNGWYLFGWPSEIEFIQKKEQWCSTFIVLFFFKYYFTTYIYVYSKILVLSKPPWERAEKTGLKSLPRRCSR